MIGRILVKLLLIFAFCSVFEQKAMGQEYPWSLQYVTNMYTINPAFVGMGSHSDLMVSTRTNWVGITKSPLSQQFSYHTPIKYQTSGVGINIRNMNIGREKQMFLTADYAYQVRLDMNHYLRFGIRAGVVNFNNTMTDYQLYPDLIPDMEFTSDVRMFFMSTVGLGTVFYNEKYFISLSIPQVVNNTFNANRKVFSSSREFQTAYLSGGYIFNMTPGIRLRPNLLIIILANKPICFDASALIYLPYDLQLGLSLRNNGELCFSGQYILNNGMRIGYAADYAMVQDIRKYQLGTYEFIVGYDFNFTKRKYSRPIYF